MPKEPEIKWMRITDLQTHERNYRTGDVEAIVKSILKFGYVGFLRMWKGNRIIAGNHALIALRQIYNKRPKSPPKRGVRVDDEGHWQVLVLDLSEFTEQEALAYMVADNHTQELGTHDDMALASILQEIADFDASAFDATGYTSDDLEDLLKQINQEAPEEEHRPDKGEEYQEKWQVKRGQLWRIPSKTAEGDHLILCGDSESIPDVNRVLQGRTPRVMVTDPPYGVEYDPGWRNEVLGSMVIEEEVEADDKMDWHVAYDLSRAEVAYVFHPGVFAGEFAASLQLAHFDIRAQIIWVKPGLVVSRGHYHWGHEPIWYAVREGCDASWTGSRKESTVWEAGTRTHAKGEGNVDAFDAGHSTQKPVPLYEKAYGNHCRRNDLVYEPFAGSGTAFVAAERRGLLCAGIEYKEKHVAAILERMTTLGLKPELVKDEETEAV